VDSFPLASAGWIFRHSEGAFRKGHPEDLIQITRRKSTKHRMKDEPEADATAEADPLSKIIKIEPGTDASAAAQLERMTQFATQMGEQMAALQKQQLEQQQFQSMQQQRLDEVMQQLEDSRREQDELRRRLELNAPLISGGMSAAHQQVPPPSTPPSVLGSNNVSIGGPGTPVHHPGGNPPAYFSSPVSPGGHHSSHHSSVVSSPSLSLDSWGVGAEAPLEVGELEELLSTQHFEFAAPGGGGGNYAPPSPLDGFPHMNASEHSQDGVALSPLHSPLEDLPS
jgi:hypothetical protein